MKDSLFPQVLALLVDAARDLVMPRFRQLKHGDVEEKSPGELVTVVDREVEALLSPALRKLLPGSRVVGEEACALQPALLDALDQGDVWLVDPLDGTGNFIAGSPDFASMVALLQQGEIVGAWMYLPVSGTLYAAELGGGAWRDGARIAVIERATNGPSKGIVRTRFLPLDLKSQVLERAKLLRDMQPGTNCAAVDYPRMVTGESDFALYWRTLPWDHAPGALFLREAGGHVARLDGSPYRPHEQRNGLLAASNEAMWHASRELLGLS
ncbi:MAG TPA: inositol monophosphatase [Ramlibacter sp.]|nr:inositol monophosphatase [Ramlibacter sp.]